MPCTLYNFGSTILSHFIGIENKVEYRALLFIRTPFLDHSNRGKFLQLKSE